MKQKYNTEGEKCYRVLRLLIRPLFYTLALLITAIMLVLFIFGSLGRTVATKTISGICTVLFGPLMYLLFQYIKSGSIEKLRHRFRKMKWPKCRLFLLFVWILSISLLLGMLDGVCFCSYNDVIGDFSTKVSRKRLLGDRVCEVNSICRVYATLPHSTNNSVFINIHTGINIDTLNVTL